MKNLFVYGSLMFDQVWRQLVNRHHEKLDATLSGYRRLQIEGQLYPGLTRMDNHSVNGVLVLGMAPKEIKILDEFEGAYYSRQAVQVTAADGQDYAAEVYVILDQYQHIMSKQDWDLEAFKKQYLKSFMTKHLGTT